MALTRSFLKAMGIDEEKIEEIIDRHVETVNALKKERDDAQEHAEEYDELKKKLIKANEKIETLEKAANDGDGGIWENKYELLKSEFETYKQDVKDKETKNAKVEAIRKLVSEIGVPERIIDKIVNFTDIKNVEIDDDGAIKDADKLTESLKEEWSDFIVSDRGTRRTNPDSPLKNNGDVVTREEFEKMTYAQRLELKEKNPELYQKLRS